MNTEKDTTHAGEGQEVASAEKSINSGQSIAQTGTQNQAPQENTAKPGRGRWNRNKLKVLPADAKVNAFAIKCYAEQMPWGWDTVKANIKATDKTHFHVIAILHDRDLVTDGIWATALEKPHFHIIVRCVDRKKRIRVRTAMGQLGIVFRPGVDDSLWENHGVETIGNYSGYATYLTHETEDAIRDGKELYDVYELVSNLTVEEILRVRDGYTRVSDGVHRVTAAELEQLDKDAYELGYKMGNFNTWYNSQPFVVRSSAKMKTIKESYTRGVEVRIEENREIIRVCIFIKGEPNTGKTYAAMTGLSGKRILPIGGGGSGKFDKLRPDHDAIVVDDDVVPNLLNMTDNYVCHAYKRNSNNPAWAGQWFIVTSNLTFFDWLNACGIKTIDSRGDITAHADAMTTRFYVCEVVESNGVKRLALRNPSTRGSVEQQIQRMDMFMDFKRAFDATIATYNPVVNHVDYSKVVEPGEW